MRYESCTYEDIKPVQKHNVKKKTNKNKQTKNRSKKLYSSSSNSSSNSSSSSSRSVEADRVVTHRKGPLQVCRCVAYKVRDKRRMVPFRRSPAARHVSPHRLLLLFPRSQPIIRTPLHPHTNTLVDKASVHRGRHGASCTLYLP